MKPNSILLLAASTLVACATTSSIGTSAHQGDAGDGLTCERRVKAAAVPEEYA